MTLITPLLDRQSLKEKMGLTNQAEPPSDNSLRILKTISARFVGLGSLFPIKSKKDHLEEQGNQLTNIKDLVQDSLWNDAEYYMYLSQEQVSILYQDGPPKMIIEGGYGTGKTTLVEFMVDKIAQDHNNPEIVLVCWS